MADAGGRGRSRWRARRTCSTAATDNRLEAVRDALAQHKAEELLAFFADSQEDESAPLEHPSVDRRFPPKRRRPADA